MAHDSPSSSHRSYKVVVASALAPAVAQAAVDRAGLGHLSPRVAANGLGSAITLTVVAGSGGDAERCARDVVGRALDSAVRVILTVVL